MSEQLLNAEVRKLTGKEIAKKLRREGKVPGIFYSHNEESIPIIVDERELMKVLVSESSLIDIQIEKKKKRKAIIREVQTDPVKQNLVHVDVMGVNLKEKVTLAVPIRFVGEAVGVKTHGGILHQLMREIEVSCLPLDLPEHIEIDVSALNVGDLITVSAIHLENVEILGEPDQAIVHVITPTVAKSSETDLSEVTEGEAGEEEAEKEK
ncbi:MAG: 50S ribosomal protein L25 [Candidatus Zhuqueibacterota bacterium]